MYHALGLVLLGLLGMSTSFSISQLPALFFVIGIIIFSGTLYLIPLTGIRWLGAITPIGGIAFIAGWFMLIYNILISRY